MNKEIVLHLSLIKGIGAAVIDLLVKRMGTQKGINWSCLYTFSVADLVAQAGLSYPIAQLVHDGLKDRQAVEQELALLERHGISWTTRYEDEYPHLLANIHLPPPILYWQGSNHFMRDTNLAIVGSRKADDYANSVINAWVPELVAHNWTIVSGGALGADTMAHSAALKAGGTTAAVIGSGLLDPYPSSNSYLFQKIVHAGGTVMSPFRLRFPPHPGNFPARNRIISGLSRGVLVVQAAEKSGARITAQHALEQGRDVFAVPGLISNPLSLGCHRLMQEGAKVTTCVEDILQEYNQAYNQVVVDRNQQLTLTSVTTGEVKPAFVPACSESSQKLANMSGELGVIARACQKPHSIEDLSVVTGLSLEQVTAHLFDLQLESLVQQDFSGLWQVSR